MKISFDNSYVDLPAQMFVATAPTPVPAPALIIYNQTLAADLGIQGDPDPAVFAGNLIPDGAAPIAQAYAGHQFGQWNPQLGDGRAVLLGEVIAQDGTRRDIQLKGSGQTPFSRRGDGRAWLGPVLREYLVSEAMHALGVPTTRALAAVTNAVLDAVLIEKLNIRLTASQDDEIDILYVNGDHNINIPKNRKGEQMEQARIQLIEEAFHRLMFAGTESDLPGKV